MPRAFRSPRSKSFRRENVSVPNADGASGVGIRGGQRRSPLGVKGGGRGRFARCRLILRQRRKRRYRQTAAWGHEPTSFDLYSMTSSAVASSVGGTVRPSDFAVFKLIMHSYLLGC